MNEGYEVKTAQDGMIAINIAQEFQPHIAILDVMMPEIDENGNFNDLLGNNSLEAPKLSKKEYTALTECFANKKHTNYEVVSMQRE